LPEPAQAMSCRLAFVCAMACFWVSVRFMGLEPPLV
jgi:hypothetical protein